MDAGAGEGKEADRHDLEEFVVSTERRGLSVTGPVRPKNDLRDVPVVGPACCNAFGTFWRAAMDEHHVGMARTDAVEAIPDEFMVVEIGAAGKGDLWPGRQETFVFGASAGGLEVTAVDDGRGEPLVSVDRA